MHRQRRRDWERAGGYGLSKILEIVGFSERLVFCWKIFRSLPSIKIKVLKYIGKISEHGPPTLQVPRRLCAYAISAYPNENKLAYTTKDKFILISLHIAFCLL